MGSLYSLLNFKIPEQLYRYLSLLYNEINKNLLAFVGIELTLPPLSEEKVNSPKGIFFGVSSNYFSSNLVSFIFFMVNIAFIIGLNMLTSCLRKKNFLRKLLGDSKWEMISGQVVNLMVPLILPWSFMMMDLGVRDFNSKLNAIGYILIYFMGLVFPIFYLFELCSEREGLLIQERKEEALKEQLKNIALLTKK